MKLSSWYCFGEILFHSFMNIDLTHIWFSLWHVYGNCRLYASRVLNTYRMTHSVREIYSWECVLNGDTPLSFRASALTLRLCNWDCNCLIHVSRPLDTHIHMSSWDLDDSSSSCSSLSSWDPESSSFVKFFSELGHLIEFQWKWFESLNYCTWWFRW